MITQDEANKRLNNLILKINETFGDVHDDDIDCLLAYIAQQGKLQVEHESLVKNVARYFELLNKLKDEEMFPTEVLFDDFDYKELGDLENKLSKVGKEE